MQFTKLIPNVFYSDIKVALELFTGALGFKIVYSDDKAEQPFYIISRDHIVIHLIESHIWAIKDRPQLRLETDDIQAAYQLVTANHKHLLHPNSSSIKLQPWGVYEFALLDKEDVCVIVQQQQN